jgi:hypothetical protein
MQVSTKLSLDKIAENDTEQTYSSLLVVSGEEKGRFN